MSSFRQNATLTHFVVLPRKDDSSQSPAEGIASASRRHPRGARADCEHQLACAWKEGYVSTFRGGSVRGSIATLAGTTSSPRTVETSSARATNRAPAPIPANVETPPAPATHQACRRHVALSAGLSDSRRLTARGDTPHPCRHVVVAAVPRHVDPASQKVGGDQFRPTCLRTTSGSPRPSPSSFKNCIAI